MRLAIISDIHANLHALEAVWQDLEQQHPEAPGPYHHGELR
jgi:predicted phosphodiesterase